MTLAVQVTRSAAAELRPALHAFKGIGALTPGIAACAGQETAPGGGGQTSAWSAAWDGSATVWPTKIAPLVDLVSAPVGGGPISAASVLLGTGVLPRATHAWSARVRSADAAQTLALIAHRSTANQ